MFKVTREGMGVAINFGGVAAVIVSISCAFNPQGSPIPGWLMALIFVAGLALAAAGDIMVKGCHDEQDNI